MRYLFRDTCVSNRYAAPHLLKDMKLNEVDYGQTRDIPYIQIARCNNYLATPNTYSPDCI